MVLLRPAALVTLMRAAGSGGRRGGRGCRRCRDPPGVWHIPSLPSAPPVRRRSAPPQPVIAAKQPFPVELKAGKKYAWCACGHSESQPFCDGAHKKAAPGISPLRFTPEEDKTAWLCGCKRTRSPPYCDGTHKEQAVQSAQLPAQP
ncbi:LOW QUALITY PROTEIN: CDGSH iron-sulfur domain-containing protein 3, mitochondrial [Gavia stellata]|uniref:LOW QUALITY PROTEIN: CDGSH iron-sulfur domain-containing protein 3, mitochondrial n=1 Tax=Gavia stellata TaxID=37040 RepID=UPI00289EC77D|nr:LOW QUALITY PROTEIN: CDGSH iron-sulfur domain-containing protein 3, mitochondrial [Gavia stellata]